MAQSPAGKPRKTPKPAALPKKAAGSSASAAIKASIDLAASHGYCFYVYALADSAGIFYIGKGTRNRVFQHELLLAADRNSAKKDRIRACGVPEKIILAFFQDADSAYAAERQLIAEHRAGLTNIQGGGAVTPRMSLSARAQSMLDRFLPFEVWENRLTEAKAAICISIAGSTREFHERLKAAIQREVESPTPTRIFIPHITGAHHG